MNTSESIAKLLLTINAVSINTKQPFRYTSGLLSPIYCDNRLVISYPDERATVIDAFLDSIVEYADGFDVIAGTATAGIPHAAWIAERLHKPMVYVRSSAKAHGKNNQIEGKIEPGKTAIVIEDMISTGGSCVNAALALREEGLNVQECFAIVTYGFDNAQHAFKQNDLNCHTLTDFNALMHAAQELGYVTDKERELAQQWNSAPSEWEKLYNAR